MSKLNPLQCHRPLVRSSVWSQNLNHCQLRWFCFVLGVATFAHVGLLDYDSHGWFWPRWCAVIAGTFLIFRPHALFACIICLTKIYTLFYLRDVLTQSLLLLCFSAAVSIALLWPSTIHNIFVFIRSITASTYLIAAIHKLNDQFMLSPQSCALHGWDVIAQAFILVPSQAKMWGHTPFIIATFTVLLELCLAWFCIRQVKWLWLLGWLFHVPLTLTLAPAFGAIMCTGYVACTPARVWASLSAKVRLIYSKHAVPQTDQYRIIFALILLLMILLNYERTWSLSVLCKLIISSSLVITVSSSQWPKTKCFALHQFKSTQGLTLLFSLMYLLHGLSPYFGIEMQHSGAMLSNLRIDPTCHNSWLAPRLQRDPYLYIDQIHFAKNHPIRQQRVQQVKDDLWSWTALATMKRNWCIPEQRPLRVSLRWQNTDLHWQTYTLDDLCTDSSEEWIRAQSDWPIGWQRFQKNLSQNCNQSCVH